MSRENDQIIKDYMSDQGIYFIPFSQRCYDYECKGAPDAWSNNIFKEALNVKKSCLAAMRNHPLYKGE